jgi:hypothetical protein
MHLVLTVTGKYRNIPKADIHITMTLIALNKESERVRVVFEVLVQSTLTLFTACRLSINKISVDSLLSSNSSFFSLKRLGKM